MPLIIPPGYGQLTFNFVHSASTKTWSTTLGLDLSAAGGEFLDALQIAAAGFRATDGPIELMDSSVTFTTATLSVGQDGGDPLHFEQTYNESGGRAIEAAPANTAMLVRKTTGLGGRRGRGRFYWPAIITDAEISDIGFITGSAVSAAQAKFDNAYDWLTVANVVEFMPLPPVILHHSEGEGVEPLPTPVLSFAVQSLAATQRRRMRS